HVHHGAFRRGRAVRAHHRLRARAGTRGTRTRRGRLLPSRRRPLLSHGRATTGHDREDPCPMHIFLEHLFGDAVSPSARLSIFTAPDKRWRHFAAIDKAVAYATR